MSLASSPSSSSPSASSSPAAGYPPAPAPLPAPARCVVDAPCRLSQSLLWPLQREFYSARGVSAWADGTVPHFVTSNAFIAAQYARIVLGFVSDAAARNPHPSDQPVYILELGAGCGKFSFLLLRALLALRAFWPPSLPRSGRPPFCLVISDLPEVVGELSRNPWLLALAQDNPGLVDFAAVDAEDPFGGEGCIALQLSRVALRPRELDHPPLVLANYVFDSLRADAFRFVPRRHGASSASAASSFPHPHPCELQLQQGLVSLTSSQAYEPTLLDPELLSRVKEEWEWRDVPGASVGIGASSGPVLALAYYTAPAESVCNTLLGSMGALLASDPLSQSMAANEGQGQGQGWTVLLPLGAVRCMETLRTLHSRGGMGVLYADKCHSTLGDLASSREPHLARHGAVSLMLNAPFLSLWTRLRAGGDRAGGSGGVHTRYAEGLRVGLEWVGMSPESTSTASAASAQPSSPSLPVLRETLLAFSALDSFSPECFSSLQRAVLDSSPGSGITLKSALALLRLSQCDADVFFKLAAGIIEEVSSSSSAAGLNDRALNDLRSDLPRILANVYPLPAYPGSPAKDVAFELGRLGMALGDFGVAEQCFERSVGDCGPHQVTAFNRGLCAQSQGDSVAALGHFQTACRLSATDYPEAREWAQKLAIELLERDVRDKLAAQSAPALPFPSTTTRSPTAAAGIDAFVRDYRGFN